MFSYNIEWVLLQLYHYFKGDKPTEYCNVCVGEFMTALQDIKDPSTGRHKHARAEQVPLMCQGVCESNQALGYKFHRQVPTAGQAEAYMKRANLLQVCTHYFLPHTHTHTLHSLLHTLLSLPHTQLTLDTGASRLQALFRV